MGQQQDRVLGDLSHDTESLPNDDHDSHFQNEIRALKIEVQRLDDEHKSEMQRFKRRRNSDLRSLKAHLRRQDSEIHQLLANEQQRSAGRDQNADNTEKRLKQIETELLALRPQVLLNSTINATTEPTTATDQPQRSGLCPYRSSQCAANDPCTSCRQDIFHPMPRKPRLFRGYQSLSPFH